MAIRAATVLTVSGVHAFYGNIEALKGVDLEVGAGEIVAMIGANGAGKSTLLMTICGNPRAARGRIVFEGRDITRLPTFEIMRLGIAHAPEGRRIFPRMTVLENLRIGAATADPRISTRIAAASSRCSRSSKNGAGSAAARCRAASSRCWRSGAR